MRACRGAEYRDLQRTAHCLQEGHETVVGFADVLKLVESRDAGPVAASDGTRQPEVAGSAAISEFIVLFHDLVESGSASGIPAAPVNKKQRGILCGGFRQEKIENPAADQRRVEIIRLELMFHGILLFFREWFQHSFPLLFHADGMNCKRRRMRAG